MCEALLDVGAHSHTIFASIGELYFKALVHLLFFVGKDQPRVDEGFVQVKYQSFHSCDLSKFDTLRFDIFLRWRSKLEYESKQVDQVLVNEFLRFFDLSGNKNGIAIQVLLLLSIIEEAAQRGD